MARKYPEGFYVYLHIRESDGLVFYVGKGSNRRAWNISKHFRKNDYWNNTKKKHGIIVKIYKSGMSEECAFTLERILISLYRKIGMPLTNITDGGEGVSGLVSSLKVPVNCSNGMRFESLVGAVEWLKLNGWPKANTSRVSAASLGSVETAYCFSWWRDGDNPKDYVDHYKNRLKGKWRRVFCSNGMSFEHSRIAAEWVEKEHGIKAYAEHISSACRGSNGVIHGYKWSYDDIFKDDWKYTPNKKAVNCSNGMEFESVSEAAKWVLESGLGKCCTSSISNACSGKEVSSYGLAWWYEGDEPKEYIEPIEVIRRKVSKPVVRSDGVIFNSGKEASIHMMMNGSPKASASAICRVARKKGKSAYGYGWKYIND